MLDLFKDPQLAKKLLPSLLLLGQFESDGTLQFVFSLPEPLILLLQLEYKVVAELLCIQFFNHRTIWVRRGLVVRSAQEWCLREENCYLLIWVLECARLL